MLSGHMSNKLLKIAKQVLFGCTLLLSSCLLLAAEFNASVTNQNIRAGQSFMLNLSLRDAKAIGNPDLTVLQQDFTIYSQQQYSTFSSVNGSVNSESGWDIMLLANQDGNLTIPSISIKTKEGVLKTRPIALSITNSAKPNKANTANNNTDKDNIGVSLVATTNKTSTYVKEPIIYTLKIITYKNLMNISLEDIKANDAIIDKIGEPKQYEQSYGGVRAHVIELKYHITPLIAGKIVINPALIRGEMQSIPQYPQGFGRGFGLLHNPFANQMGSLEPFSLRGEKISFTSVAPPIKDPNWLPLQNLVLTQEWVGLDGAKVGDTIIRKVKIVGTGTLSNQLPSVKSYMDLSGLKIYADTPSFDDSPSKNNEEMIGTKEEVFTIVPTEPGKKIFPAIKISWWNLRTKRLETALLEAKTVEILPAVNSVSKDVSVDYTAPGQAILGDIQKDKIIGSANSPFYIIIAGMLAVIIAMLTIILYLVLKKKRVTKNHQVPINNKTESSMQEAPAIDQLRDNIVSYAQTTWKISDDVGLARIGEQLTKKGFSYSHESYSLMCEKLNSALYARAAIDISELNTIWDKFRRSVVKIKNPTDSTSKKQQEELNPT